MQAAPAVASRRRNDLTDLAVQQKQSKAAVPLSCTWCRPALAGGRAVVCCAGAPALSTDARELQLQWGQGAPKPCLHTTQHSTQAVSSPGVLGASHDAPMRQVCPGKRKMERLFQGLPTHKHNNAGMPNCSSARLAPLSHPKVRPLSRCNPRDRLSRCSTIHHPRGYLGPPNQQTHTHTRGLTASRLLTPVTAAGAQTPLTQTQPHTPTQSPADTTQQHTRAYPPLPVAPTKPQSAPVHVHSTIHTVRPQAGNQPGTCCALQTPPPNTPNPLHAAVAAHRSSAHALLPAHAVCASNRLIPSVLSCRLGRCPGRCLC